MNPQPDQSIKKCNHRNCWLICGGGMVWCYECGAIRPNVAGSRKAPIHWQKPSYTKENPAIKDNYSAQSWDKAR